VELVDVDAVEPTAIRAADEGMDVRTVVPASSRVASTTVELVDVDAVEPTAIRVRWCLLLAE
jgi:hypothetical protein